MLDYQELLNEIDYLEFQLDRNKRELKRWNYGDLQDVKIAEGAIASTLEERIAAMEHELAHKMNDLYDTKKLINTFKGLENQILYYKYVEGMTLNEVAIELDYTPGHIYNKHAEIMKRIEFVHKITSF